MQHWRLGDLLSSQSNNIKLVKALKLIKLRETSGSLADYDNFNFTEFAKFASTIIVGVSTLEIIISFFIFYLMLSNGHRSNTSIIIPWCI